MHPLRDISFTDELLDIYEILMLKDIFLGQLPNTFSQVVKYGHVSQVHDVSNQSTLLDRDLHRSHTSSTLSAPGRTQRLILDLRVLDSLYLFS